MRQVAMVTVDVVWIDVIMVELVRECLLCEIRTEVA